MDTDFIKSFKNLTLEPGRGETYSSGEPSLYAHDTYGRGSVMAGRPRRIFLESWETAEEARAALQQAGIRYTDLIGSGSTHVPLRVATAGIPGDEL